jgi:hypothetical protein
MIRMSLAVCSIICASCYALTLTDQLLLQPHTFQEIKDILMANQKVTCDASRSFYLKYTNIRVGEPCVEEDLIVGRYVAM